MITIKEIAQQLNVSPTTVSNVLNGRAGKMSADTRKKVEEALIRNHYVRERKDEEGNQEQMLIALYFRQGKREHVLTDPFCGGLIEGAEKEITGYGRAMLFGVVEQSEQIEEKMNRRNIEGAVILDCEPGKCEELTRKIRQPVVFVDSGEGNYDNIGLQDLEGAYEAISYLIGQGHEKIAFFSDQMFPPVTSNLQRWKGYRKAMQQNGLEWSRDDYYYLPVDMNLRHEVLRQFARSAKEEGYTAAFFVSDLLANEGINIFFANELLVPDDISVVGFDDNMYASLSRPMLTTVRQNAEEKGRVAVWQLMNRIYGKDVVVRCIHLPTELIVRDSVRNIEGVKAIRKSSNTEMICGSGMISESPIISESESEFQKAEVSEESTDQ